MKQFVRLAALAAAVGGLSLAGTTKAASVTATLDTVSPAQIVGITYNGNWLGQAYAGEIRWTGVAGNGYGLTGNFGTYCIDLTQDVYLGSTYTYDVADLAHAPNPLPPTAPVGGTGMGATNMTYVQNLYSLEYDNVGGDNDRGAAFQIALWEMLYDTAPSHDVGSGMFTVSGASSNVMNLANQFVANATTHSPMTFHNDLFAMTSATVQDQIFLGGEHVDVGGGPPAVPTPAAAFAAMPLLGGLAAMRRHKRRNGL